MSLPGWAREAKLAEDSYSRKQTAYGRITGSLLITMALALLGLNYAGKLTSIAVQAVTLSFLFIILVIALLQDDVIPAPAFPTYQRLATVLYCIGENLGVEGKAEKEDLKNQLDRLLSLITKQEPEFKKKDLVFGVAVSVLGKLTEVRKRLSAAPKSEIPKDSLSTVQSNLHALASMIFQSKTINARDIETVTDALLSNMSGFPLPTPVPLVQHVSALLYRLSNRQALLMEVVVSLFIGVLAAFIFNMGVPGGLVVFLAMVAFLDVIERRLRQGS